VVTTKNKRLAQERARQMAETQRRAVARRKRLTVAGAAIAVVLVALGTLIAVKAGRGAKTPTAGSTAAGSAATAAANPLPPSVLTALSSLPANVLDQVGAGAVSNPPKAIRGQTVLTDGGKPLILYVGAEYCPFCAAQRWATVVALARFGTFTNLGQAHSSASDVFPNTATVTFHGATYTSQYLQFQGVETQSNERKGNSYAPLDTLSDAQRKLLQTFNAPPYVSDGGSIPFIDFANQAVISGASYSPQLLAGKTVEQIAAALSDPTNPITKAIGGTANAFTTQLCQLTANQPAAVCSSSAATAYQGKLGG
jgi:hypothetical protein